MWERIPAEQVDPDVEWMVALGARSSTRPMIPPWPSHDYTYGASRPELRPDLGRFLD